MNMIVRTSPYGRDVRWLIGKKSQILQMQLEEGGRVEEFQLIDS